MEDGRAVTIPKPGKDNYGLSKSCRAISLLNRLGKMVEKAATKMISSHCEATGGIPPGQCGYTARRLAGDAVGVTIVQAQEAWSQGCITGTFHLNVASAFPSVARGCLLRKMRGMGLDECLVQCAE